MAGLAAAVLAVAVGCAGRGDDRSPPATAMRLFVTNEASGTISVIDPATGATLGAIDVGGKRPRGIKASPDGRWLYVSLSGTVNRAAPASSGPTPSGTGPDRPDGIGVVDPWTLTLARMLPGGSDPQQFVVSRDGTRLYVPDESSSEAAVWDAQTGQVVAAIAVGREPEGAAISPDGRIVYITSEADSEVTVIDTASHRVVRRVAVGARPRGAAFSPDGTRAFVTSENDATVSVIDTTSHDVIRAIHLAGENVRPMGVVVAPDGGRVFVTTGRGRTVHAIDAATFTPAGAVEVGDRPWGIAITPDGRTLYTANGPSNDVTVVDARTLTVVKRIPVGERPWGVIVVGGAGKVAVGDNDSR